MNSSVLCHLPLICGTFEKLNPATNFINLENGLLDLSTFTLMPHSKIFASLVQLPFDYDPEAKCPRFQEFLRQVFREDEELISLALLARKLALNTVIVLEQEEELDLVIGLSKKMSVRHGREEGSFVLGFWRQFCLQILHFF